MFHRIKDLPFEFHTYHVKLCATVSLLQDHAPDHAAPNAYNDKYIKTAAIR